MQHRPERHKKTRPQSDSPFIKTCLTRGGRKGLPLTLTGIVLFSDTCARQHGFGHDSRMSSAPMPCPLSFLLRAPCKLLSCLLFRPYARSCLPSPTLLCLTYLLLATVLRAHSTNRLGRCHTHGLIIFFHHVIRLTHHLYQSDQNKNCTIVGHSPVNFLAPLPPERCMDGTEGASI